jgi:hypothetical protein
MGQSSCVECTDEEAVMGYMYAQSIESVDVVGYGRYVKLRLMKVKFGCWQPQVEWHVARRRSALRCLEIRVDLVGGRAIAVATVDLLAGNQQKLRHTTTRRSRRLVLESPSSITRIPLALYVPSPFIH